MDDSQRIAQKIISWIREYQKALNIKITAYKWPSTVGVNFFDCSVECVFMDRRLTGGATGLSEELALTKALAELTERAAMINSKQGTSNGFAAHTTKDRVKILARREIVERDSFFYHYLCQQSPNSINFKECLSTTAHCCHEFFDYNGVNFNLSELQSLTDEKVVLAVGDGLKSNNPFGLCIGLGCDETLELAAEKAFWECCRHLVVAVTDLNKRKSINLDSFNKIADPGPLEHMALAMDLDYAQEAMKWLKPRAREVPSQKNKSELQFSERFIDLPTPFDQLPYFVAQSKCEALQGLFFGNTIESKVNFKRFKKAEDIKWEIIKKFPHPLG